MIATLGLAPWLMMTAFTPVLVESSMSPAEVRPGGMVQVMLRFMNEGDQAADREYRVFLHLEDPVQGCEALLVNGDHEPLASTTIWMPGETILDGPFHLRVPLDRAEGPLRIHTGLFDLQTGRRLLDAEVGQVMVSATAPEVVEPGPPPLPADELARRRGLAAGWLESPWTLRGEGWAYQIDRRGRWQLQDLRAGVDWSSSPLHDRFGLAILRHGDRSWPAALDDWQAVSTGPGALVLTQALRVPDGTATGLTLRLTISPEAAPPGGVDFRFAVEGEGEWRLDRLTALEDALPTTEAEAGRAIIPYRLGESITAATDRQQVRSLLTYSQASMQMVALEKAGAALLATWDHVDVRTITRLAWLDEPQIAGRRAILESLELLGDARGFRLHPLGPGDYATAARAYRQVAERAGWRVTRAAELPTRPQLIQMAGAADFKPGVFSRTVVGSRYNTTGVEKTSVNYQFADTAGMAEHWRHDLDLDRAFVVLAGWINRGYDNTHPDILPAAAECGGNEGLAAAGERIRALGYPFGLHDNYQDMYADAPTFDTKYLRKSPTGEPMKGGNWAGGQAWQVRPQDQVALAERNLPQIRDLFHPSIFFIDTVFATPLVDSQYPADRWDRTTDMEYKSRLSRYAQTQMGLYGSEEGREWAVPVADYLEGLYNHKYDRPPGEVTPFFLMTYHDCVSTFTHQGTRIGPDDDKHVLDSLIYGEMPLYRFGRAEYWNRTEAESLPLTVAAEVVPTGPGEAELTLLWSPAGPLPAGARAFIHYTHAGAEREGIAWQDDHDLSPTEQWQPGQVYRDGPRRIAVPEGLAGEFGLEVGLVLNGARLPLAQRATGNLRYRLGTVQVRPGELVWRPAPAEGLARPFARREGWAQELLPTDRFIKNTYEVLSYVHRLTFTLPFEDQRVDGEVEETRFGDDFHIVVNYGATPVTRQAGPVLGEVTLPRFGFAVWSPGFVAVHATAAGGRTYPTPALYTARSLDGKPLPQSGEVRIYHGCGGPELGLAGRTYRVDRELTTRLGGWGQRRQSRVDTPKTHLQHRRS